MSEGVLLACRQSKRRMNYCASYVRGQIIKWFRQSYLFGRRYFPWCQESDDLLNHHRRQQRPTDLSVSAGRWNITRLATPITNKLIKDYLMTTFIQLHLLTAYLLPTLTVMTPVRQKLWYWVGNASARFLTKSETCVAHFCTFEQALAGHIGIRSGRIAREAQLS